MMKFKPFIAASLIVIISCAERSLNISNESSWPIITAMIPDGSWLTFDASAELTLHNIYNIMQEECGGPVSLKTQQGKRLANDNTPVLVANISGQVIESTLLTNDMMIFDHLIGGQKDVWRELSRYMWPGWNAVRQIDSYESFEKAATESGMDVMKFAAQYINPQLIDVQEGKIIALWNLGSGIPVEEFTFRSCRRFPFDNLNDFAALTNLQILFIDTGRFDFSHFDFSALNELKALQRFDLIIQGASRNLRRLVIPDMSGCDKLVGITIVDNAFYEFYRTDCQENPLIVEMQQQESFAMSNKIRAHTPRPDWGRTKIQWLPRIERKRKRSINPDRRPRVIWI